MGTVIGAAAIYNTRPICHRRIDLEVVSSLREVESLKSPEAIPALNVSSVEGDAAEDLRTISACFAANALSAANPEPITESLAHVSSDAELQRASLLNLNDAVSASYAHSANPDHHGPQLDPGVLRSLSFRFGKRLFDVAFSAAALIMLSPVLLVCVIAILIDSPGPVLFRQRRLGKGGKEFRIVKFRTMRPDAEAVLNDLLERDPVARAEWQKDRKLRADPRVTRVGRFLRRSSLDELPQFWNVLAGEMSVVGPRPIVSAEIPLYRRAWNAYCAVRPGVTGLWQVSGRNDTGYERRVQLDQEYVSRWSATLDVNIVFRTIRCIVDAAGAY